MYFIAEIGSNWEGDMNLAKRTINACHSAGADAVKFQLWDADIIYNGKYKEFQMSFDQFTELYEFSKSLGITCFATPSYPEAVDFLESLHIPFYKIASVTSGMKHENALEVMKKVADTGKPVFISYGYGDETYRIFNKNEKFNMECIPEHPANPTHYKNGRYTNLSDHTKGTSLMWYWIRNYVDPVIEKHIKLRNNKSPDSPFSLYTDELADFITLSKSSLFKFG